MTIFAICQWLEDTRLGSLVRETNWGYGSAQMLHLLGMALFGGAVVMDDLRLLGRLRRPAMTELLDQLLPLKWWGLAVTALSGMAIFISDATRLYTNPAFLAKIVLLLLVGSGGRSPGRSETGGLAFTPVVGRHNLRIANHRIHRPAGVNVPTITLTFCVSRAYNS
jgi:Family of unknown function (DUF6644)